MALRTPATDPVAPSITAWWRRGATWHRWAAHVAYSGGDVGPLGAHRFGPRALPRLIS